MSKLFNFMFFNFLYTVKELRVFLLKINTPLDKRRPSLTVDELSMTTHSRIKGNSQ